MRKLKISENTIRDLGCWPDVEDAIKEIAEKHNALIDQLWPGDTLYNALGKLKCPCCKSKNTSDTHLDGVRYCLDCDAEWAI